jgi:uncharacterized membrane protein
MANNLPMQIIDVTAEGLEFVGVVVITIGFIYAGFRALVPYKRKKPNPYDQLKVSIGRALQLGLEFLIAADIISTVTVEPTREKIVSLALLIVVRTFLSWSIAVEIEGCWPWQVASKGKDEGYGRLE